MNTFSAFFKRIKAVSLRKKISFIIILIVVCGLYLYLRPKKTAPQYETAQVEIGTVISTVSESGNVSASSQINVDSPTNGIVEAVYVKNGDWVQPGQNLLKVKSSASNTEKASAYANYLSAQNGLSAAQAKLNSLQSSEFKANQAFMNDAVANNVPSDDPKYIEQKADWLQAEADYKNQAGIIAQAQAALSAAALANAQVQDAMITAPASGTVANFSAVVGSFVSSGGGSSSTGSNSSSNTSDPVLVIGNFSNLVIEAQVSEVDIPSIKVGQNATVTLDAFPDKTFVGKVTSVDSIGSSSSGVVTYMVSISLISPPKDIKPGMSASVMIETARHDNVLTVPNTALQTINGQSYVRVLKNGNITQVAVSTGIASDESTEITSGLTQGDEIITSVNLPTNSSTGASPFSNFGSNRSFSGGTRSVSGGGAARGGGTFFISK